MLEFSLKTVPSVSFCSTDFGKAGEKRLTKLDSHLDLSWTGRCESSEHDEVYVITVVSPDFSLAGRVLHFAWNCGSEQGHYYIQANGEDAFKVPMADRCSGIRERTLHILVYRIGSE